MVYYYRMRVTKPGTDSVYFFKSGTDMLDLTRGYPRIPNGEVMLSEISKETYDTLLKDARKELQPETQN